MDSSRKYLHSTHLTTAVNSAQVFKLHPNAELPQLDPEDEIGFYWDIHVHSRDQNRNDDLTNQMNVFNTGFSLVAPTGFHFEFVEHPDLWRSGYWFHSAPLITSFSDSEEEIKVVLYKFEEGDDLDLPHPVARAFLRENCSCPLNVVRTGKPALVPTQRKRAQAVEEFDYGPTVVPVNTKKNKGYGGGSLA